RGRSRRSSPLRRGARAHPAPGARHGAPEDPAQRRHCAASIPRRVAAARRPRVAALKRNPLKENRDMGRKVYVVGGGMTRFEKRGSKAWDYPGMAREAGQKALADATSPYDQVEQVAVGYCYGDSTAGERAVYEIGLSGVPIYNVNNNCSTGSPALFMA